jgi:hypothetical protein
LEILNQITGFNKTIQFIWTMGLIYGWKDGLILPNGNFEDSDQF